MDPVHWNEQNVNNVVNRNYTLPKYKNFLTIPQLSILY